ncbi:MAG: 4-alpha-glucanotransferase [Oscillospiraceae bacterium]|nr:4-alpha-glucanotransferase [Oscillospiraceae bacterium]
MLRSSGILLPMSALPSPHGIGTMGHAAYEFVDFLRRAHQTYWQLLPLGPTGYGDSPYSSFSSFAGNPYYIDLDLLAEEGLLLGEEVETPDWGDHPGWVDYGKIYNSRFAVLRLAYRRADGYCVDERAAFHAENADWLTDYTLYMAVKSHFDLAAWVDWPDEGIRLHRPEAVAIYSKMLRDEIGFYEFLQFLFFRQWENLRRYAHENGIQLIGDIPIYVALDSADVWSAPGFFQLDEKNLPVEVAGVPPDALNDEGQLWGNPLYDWERMRRDGYGWWIRRVGGAQKLYDVVRIDHFRGFESYWAVPSGDNTAQNGRWRPGPGMELVGLLTSWFPQLRFIAENLGYLTPEVAQLLSDSGLPGMKILEFGFDPHSESDYAPHNCVYHSICYVGTHDNETVTGWLEGAGKGCAAYAADYMHITPDEGWCWGMIRTGMSTASRLFIVQMQDVLEAPPWTRMNEPGIADGNWRWRLQPGEITPALTEKLREYTVRYRRG